MLSLLEMKRLCSFSLKIFALGGVEKIVEYGRLQLGHLETFFFPG